MLCSLGLTDPVLMRLDVDSKLSEQLKVIVKAKNYHWKLFQTSCEQAFPLRFCFDLLSNSALSKCAPQLALTAHCSRLIQDEIILRFVKSPTSKNSRVGVKGLTAMMLKMDVVENCRKTRQIIYLSKLAQLKICYHNFLHVHWQTPALCSLNFSTNKSTDRNRGPFLEDPSNYRTR